MLRYLLTAQSTATSNAVPVPLPWTRALTAAAADLAHAVGETCREGEATHRKTAVRAYTTALAEPGFLCPMTVMGAEGFFVHLTPRDVAILSSVLLRIDPTLNAAEKGLPRIERLDMLLAAQAVRAFVAGLADALGTIFSIPGESEPLVEWPLDTLKATGEWAVVTIPVAINTHRVSLALLLPADEPSLVPFATEQEDPEPETTAAALCAPVTIEASLDRWQSTAKDIAALSPGSILPLPTASLDRITLTTRAGGRALAVGQGTHGKSGQRQAVMLARGFGAFHGSNGEDPPVEDQAVA